MIKYILLGYLKYQPMTGYDLKQSLDHSVSHFWHAHHSQIYTTLRKLDNDGLVSSEIIPQQGSPDRRLYTITAAGQQEMESWINQPMTHISLLKEEYLVRLFFSAERNPQEVIAELILQIKLHEEKLQVFYQLQHHLENNARKEHPEFERDIHFWLFTLKMGLSFEEMYIQWLNNTLHEIQNM
ncbi:MAG: PadR family transcriptional regulator [Anaerolineaceae bacterium]|nr:PadR family transcriptional regulator [Anaerolineaceae bacterium]